jgi:hypothetical protein
VFEHEFLNIGFKVLLLNARILTQKAPLPQLILLAIEDITNRQGREGEQISS